MSRHRTSRWVWCMALLLPLGGFCLPAVAWAQEDQPSGEQTEEDQPAPEAPEEVAPPAEAEEPDAPAEPGSDEGEPDAQQDAEASDEPSGATDVGVSPADVDESADDEPADNAGEASEQAPNVATGAAEQTDVAAGAAEDDTEAADEPSDQDSSATDEQTAGMWGETAQEEEPGPTAEPVQPDPSGPELLEEDELLRPGYVPGYRKHLKISGSRYSPRRGSFAGGMTPTFGTPMPADDWVFEFSGFMTASLQFTIDTRRFPDEDQRETVFHIPPQTVDTYGFFTSTATVPGNWVTLRFKYGNPRVSANLSIDTWNPSRPTTFYQLGSQYFVNNAFLEWSPRSAGPLTLKVRGGRFNLNYGKLGRYGGGLYVNALVGGPQGIGGLVSEDLRIGEVGTLRLEQGFMVSRDGTIPANVIPGADVGWRRPVWSGSVIPHAHARFTFEGTPKVQLQGHYLGEFSIEDRNDAQIDNPSTVQVDESDVEDASINVVGADVRVGHDAFGWLTAGVSQLTARNAFPLHGIVTYGGTGELLTNNYLGATSRGNGALLIFGANYDVSIGKLVNHPGSFAGDGPDIVVNTGFHLVKVASDFEEFDGRVRHKYGADVLYTLLPFMGVGLRADRVVPNSKDDGETFHVLAPRVVFKTDWITHESIQLIYAKWFYGERTRNEGTGLRTLERLDDQLVAFNFNMWW